MNTVAHAATGSEVVAICGHLDDGVIARIIATGATPAEVLEAFTWFSADDQIGTEPEGILIARVVDLEEQY